MKSISAADANRHFSALLREVSRGASVTVLSRGKPVAIIAPVDSNATRARAAAKRTLLSRLRKVPADGRREWTRDELYQ